VVDSLGLLYTTFAQGHDSIMVPNNVVLTAAVVPLREPASVDLRARLRPDVKPSDLQSVLEDSVQTPARSEPRISLEEVDRDEVIVRIAATPLAESDGPRLADEVLSAIAVMTREGDGGDREPLGDDDDDDPRRAQITQQYESYSPLLLASSYCDATLSAPSLRCTVAATSGARLANAVPSRRPIGATSISERLCSIARTTARATSSGFFVPTYGGSLAPESWNMPASLMKPGKIVETPTPRDRMSSRRLWANPRSPNFVAAYSDVRTVPTFPLSELTNTMWPPPRSAMPSHISRARTIGARRLTSST
jgi:hypothetical protein